MRAPTEREGRLHAVLLVAVFLAALTAIPAGAQLNTPFHRDGWILAAAHAPGAYSSIWRTDLWVATNGFSPSSGTVSLTFCRQGIDNSAAVAIPLPLTGYVTHVEDVVDHFLNVGGGSWVGAIHYVTSETVQVWARVYSISPDGSRSYGQVIEGIPTAQFSPGFETPGYTGTREDQWMYAGQHTANGRFRVNVGMVNPTAVASLFYIQMFDADGNGGVGQAMKTVQVPAYSMVQLSDPFAAVDGGEWSEKQIRVEAEAAGSGAFGYISVADNATNDAYFVRGVKQIATTEP